MTQRFFFNFMAILALALFGWSGPALAAPLVIFKMDDLKAAATNTGFSTPWDRLFNYVDSKPLIVSVGVIGESLASSNPAYTASIRRIHETGRVEFWHHGYLHIRDQPVGTFEFRGTGFEYQQSNLQITQNLAREHLGFPFLTFGAPFNATDDVTRQVLEADPDIQTSLFGPSGSNLLDLKRWLNLEASAGVILDYNTFVANYEGQRHRPYLVLQGHPVSWSVEEFATFTQIVDFLIADGAKFTTPSGYRAQLDSDGDQVPDVIERILGRDPALAEIKPPLDFDPSESRVVFELAATQPARPRLALESSSDFGTWTKTQIFPNFMNTLPDGRRRIEVPVSMARERTFWRLCESSEGVFTWP